MKKLFPFLALCLFATSIFAQNKNVVLRAKKAYPGQTLANICGYWKGAKEYALLGASQGLLIVDVTNPAAPTDIVQIPGPNNLWKEIKTYKQYAYVTSEGGQGLQIVDMSKLPLPTLDSKFYKGDSTIAGQLDRIHALHIDTLKGVVYCFGTTGLAGGGAVMLDIKTDPYNPKYLGVVAAGGYIHDGFAHNDTLYAAHIYRGDMEIYDTKDKKNPKSLGKIATPTKFTHNIWLSENHKYAYTTDENNNSLLGAYDVSNPADIKQVDKILTSPGSGAVVHNTHIINDFAVSSYYTEGFTIVDAHRPNNLVEVGKYDTYDLPTIASDPFNGAWGVFPYFPSGTIVVSNIDEGLYVLSPKYVRAAYLEGTVKDKISKVLLSNVVVKIDKYVTADDVTNLKGEFKTGVADSGKVSVTFAKAGYTSLTKEAIVNNGVVTILDVELQPLGTFTMSATVKEAGTNTLLDKVKVAFVSKNQTVVKETDAQGKISFTTFADTFTVYVGKWGYNQTSSTNFVFTADASKNFELKKGYRDDIISALKFNWISTATATAGNWEAGVPIGLEYQNTAATPSDDEPSDIGNECYLTGNLPGQPGGSDVDNGDVTLTSPEMDLTANNGYSSPGIRFKYWFFNGGGNGSLINDSLYMVVDNGTIKKTRLIAKGDAANKWNTFEVNLKDIGVPASNKVKVSFIAIDNQAGHIVKAAIDVFEAINNKSVGVNEINENITINTAPNPFANTITIEYQLLTNEKSILHVTDINGKIIETHNLSDTKGNLNIGEKLNTGIYFVQIQTGNTISLPRKIVKL